MAMPLINKYISDDSSYFIHYLKKYDDVTCLCLLFFLFEVFIYASVRDNNNNNNMLNFK